MEERCPKTEKCPLFQGQILVSSVAQEIYMDLYCTKGVKGRSRCMRYNLSEALKIPVPVDVMPNDKRNFEDLLQRLRKID